MVTFVKHAIIILIQNVRTHTHLHNTTRNTRTPAAAICSTINLLTIRTLFILVRHMLLSMLILWEIPSKLFTVPAFVIVDFQGAQTIC